MANKCLYCYEPLTNGTDYHESCAKKFFGLSNAPELPYTLDQMSGLAKNVIERSIAVPGVQPKLSLSLIKETLQKNIRLTVVGALGGQYIFKPPHHIYPQMPENEHLTMRLAESYGIKVVTSSLIRLSSGELAYITKRIDRKLKGQKIHMLDMCQITEAFDKYKSSYEKIAKAIELYSDNAMLDKILFFELLLFCFITGNNDMHLKNFSLIKGSSGWSLSPAYDLLNTSIILPEDKEELALTIQGKKKKINRENFELFGKQMNLTEKQINGVFNRFKEFKKNAEYWIYKSFLSVDMQQQYIYKIKERFKQLDF
jgi:serine/threonine-protein kinase HipA